MTTKTKTITQTVPTKPIIRKCFICSGPIPMPSARKPRSKIKSTTCKTASASLYISKTRKILGQEDLLRPLQNVAGNQNILPTSQFNDTTKVLGY
jgi:hypothetical protein